jgi:hypothetical protein
MGEGHVQPRVLPREATMLRINFNQPDRMFVPPQ